MENIDLGTPLKETIEGLRNYIDHLISFNKLVIAKKMGQISSYLSLIIALGFLASLALIFLSFGFVWWFSDGKTEEMYIGFLIVSGFYALIAILIYVFRERLIFKPIRKELGNVVFADVNEEEKDEVFESSEMFDARIKSAKENLDSKEKELNQLVEGLGETYTLKNVGRNILQNLYSSFVTTSNIGKLAFSLVTALQNKRSKKRVRRSETDSPKIKSKRK